MSHLHAYEYTDLFCGEANYSWMRRGTVTMPDLTHYGFDGSSNYVRANRIYERELVKRAKAAVGLTGVRGRTLRCGTSIEFRPYQMNTVLFILDTADC